ncbi:MAG: hypothetical protein ABIQ52_19495 [Vicinamibacterales bacterium]
MRRIAHASMIVATVIGCAAGALAAQGSAPEIATRMSGTWKLNLELSPSVAAGRGRGRGRSGRGGSFALGLAPPQRGGGGDRGSAPSGEGSSPMPAEEVAAQRLLHAFEEVPTDVTLTATADAITVKENSGQGTFEVNGKTIDIQADGARLKSKSKWDKDVLKQEFWSARRKVVRTWSLDPAGHLILQTKIESMMNNGETKAVFDRQS